MVYEDFKDVQYCEIGEKTQICCLVLPNGYEITGAFTASKDKVPDESERRDRAYQMAVRNLERANEKRRQRDR